MRYLDIDKTIKAFEEQHGSESTLLNCYNADWILSFIESQPTADVQEVRHGRWINESRNMYGPISAQCSVCELFSGTWLRNAPYKYCPHCGAKMDGGKKQDDNHT